MTGSIRGRQSRQDTVAPSALRCRCIFEGSSQVIPVSAGKLAWPRRINRSRSGRGSLMEYRSFHSVSSGHFLSLSLSLSKGDHAKRICDLYIKQYRQLRIRPFNYTRARNNGDESQRNVGRRRRTNKEARCCHGLKLH